MPQVKISTRGARRIRQGHLWVYRSDVRDASDAEGGSIVRALDDAGNFVGQAFYSDRSEIALRFLSTDEAAIDREWWRRRLRQCAESRSAIASNSNAYRLVYSEGDLLPSLIIDVYDNVLVLQTLSQGSDKLKSMLVELLREEFNPRAVIERNDARVRQFEGLELQSGLIYGEAVDEIEINQHGVRFVVSPLGGQKTGAFLDQRENYLAARHVAEQDLVHACVRLGPGPGAEGDEGAHHHEHAQRRPEHDDRGPCACDVSPGGLHSYVLHRVFRAKSLGPVRGRRQSPYPCAACRANGSHPRCSAYRSSGFAPATTRTRTSTSRNSCSRMRTTPPMW